MTKNKDPDLFIKQLKGVFKKLLQCQLRMNQILYPLTNFIK